MTWRFISLLALGVVFYAVMAMNIATLRSSAAARKRMAATFAVISGIGVWIVLFQLLGMAIPEWSLLLSAFVGIALSVAPIVSLVDGALGRRRYVTLILPLPFLAMAIWLRLA